MVSWPWTETLGLRRKSFTTSMNSDKKAQTEVHREKRREEEYCHECDSQSGARFCCGTCRGRRTRAERSARAVAAAAQDQARHAQRARALSALAAARGGGQVQHPDRVGDVPAVRRRAHGARLGRHPSDRFRAPRHLAGARPGREDAGGRGGRRIGQRLPGGAQRRGHQGLERASPTSASASEPARSPG